MKRIVIYKYKLYRTHRTKYLDKMLAEACFVWNHALALQKRYYRLYGKYIPLYTMQKHQAKRIKREFLDVNTIYDVLERLDTAFRSFFKHSSKRPPKFKKQRDFNFLLFKTYKTRNGKICVHGLIIKDNQIIVSRINKTYKFGYYRNVVGLLKRVHLYKNKLGEYFLGFYIEKEIEEYRKTRNGASVGIDFGIKTYLTLSDNTKYDNPLFLKKNLSLLCKKDRNLSKCKKGSNNRERKRKELDRLYNNITNKRSDFQWKLSHELCRKYDNIFIEDLNLMDMNLGRKTNRKLLDLAHAEFVSKLEHIATKYGVVIHKIDRYYPSSKTCTCGYVNKDLKLTDRQWTCPHCGTTHDRDLLAANNILRRGIYELESDSKTLKHSADGQSRNHPTITRVTA